ncbi:hypothetical protein D3C81_1380680 [compost metagenome]
MPHTPKHVLQLHGLIIDLGLDEPHQVDVKRHVKKLLAVVGVFRTDLGFDLLQVIALLSQQILVANFHGFFPGLHAPTSP